MNVKKPFSDQRGDTIIEVMLAMAILSMILFISWGLTNRATQISLNARKRIEMVNQLKEQAEIIQSLYVSTSGSTAQIVGSTPAVPGATDLQVDPCTTLDMTNPNGTPSNPFYLSVSGSTITSTAGVKQVAGQSDSRVWIQYKDGSGYRDFYVRGCWYTLGGQQKLDNSNFVVRLNT